MHHTVIMSSGSPRIPPELYRPIMEYISDKSTLQRLCLTSKTVQLDAERVLYRQFAEYSTSINLRFLNTMANNRRLAALVKEYRCWFMHHDSESWKLFGSGLNNMVNLKALEYFSSSTPLQIILHAPFQLEKLVWRCYSDQDVLEKILVKEQNLKVLYLREDTYTTRPGQSICADACPNLHTLAGNSYPILGILPGRQIKEIGWEQCRKMIRSGNPLITEEQAKEFSSVKLLSFAPTSARPSLRDIGAQNLQNLEVLQLFGWFPEEEYEILQLSSLRELVISNRYPSPSASLTHNMTLAQCEQLVGALFESSSSSGVLAQIDIFCPVSERRAGYYRWKRELPGCLEYIMEGEIQARFIHLSLQI